MIRYRYTTKSPSRLGTAENTLQAQGWQVSTTVSYAASWISVTSDQNPGEVEGAILAVLPDAFPLDRKEV